MINKDILKGISEFDEKATTLDYQELVDNLDILEKAHAKIHSLLITTRMRKLMNNFGEQETDIYVVSYPRSGTTLMQMILYQLTTDGDMEFKHIYDVSPWSRFSAFFNRPMPSVGKRRIIKTHDPYQMLAHLKKAKFVFLMRDCLDVIPSIHQQTKDYIDPSVGFDVLSDRNMKNWFTYNMEWIENKNNLQIVYVNYEDLVGEKHETIQSISNYLQIDIDESVVKRVLQRTSFDFMKKHESKFGDQPDQWKVYTNFIRNGRVGEGKTKFTDEQLEAFYKLSREHEIRGTKLERYFV